MIKRIESKSFFSSCNSSAISCQCIVADGGLSEDVVCFSVANRNLHEMLFANALKVDERVFVRVFLVAFVVFSESLSPFVAVEIREERVCLLRIVVYVCKAQTVSDFQTFSVDGRSSDDEYFVIFVARCKGVI